MAGFTGVFGNAITDSVKKVNEAAHVTVYSQNSSAKNVYNNEHLILCKSSLNILESSNKYFSDGTVYVWLDGEIFNEGQIISKGETFCSVLFKAYQSDDLAEFLKKIDGVFTALIYDIRNKKLHIVTDRYGLKFLYLYKSFNELIFASELKSFPFFNSFKLDIRKDIIDCFMQLEHFIGNTTWFTGVELTEPSSVYTYSLESQLLQQEYYWSWSLIKATSIPITDAAEQMQYLLSQAIKKRFSDHKMGVGLSGGYDSRAILAAIHEQKPSTYTFGIAKSADVKIAKQVANVANVPNTHFDIYVSKWIQERFSGVWKTDGMLNMYHMHYSHLMPMIEEMIDVNLSGYLGDVVLGGSYLSKKSKSFLNQRVTEESAEHYYGKHHAFADVTNSFFNIDKIDPYLIYNRGRRMIGLGMEEANKTIYQRMPFMDNGLLDFAYSLPDEYRADGMVYQLGLLLKYPQFFESIPNATTGVSIQRNPSLYFTSKKSLNRFFSLVKYKLGFATSYTDVANWIKRPEAARFISDLLNNKSALYKNYTSNDFYELYFLPHLKNKGNYSKQVMGAVTLEIWLQQILNKKYR